MKIIRAIEEYVLQNKLEINVTPNSVDVVNYKDIGSINSSRVEVKYDKGIIGIVGDKLVVSRLLNNEILVTGIIKNIELR